MSKKSKFPEIKQAIKDRETQSREMRKRMNQTSGLERHSIWNEKKGYGFDTRALLLLYAFLRKVPYRAVERKCCLGERYYISYCIGKLLKTYNLELEIEDIEAWLQIELPTKTEAA